MSHPVSAFIDALTTSLELHATEARIGMRLVEAVAADETISQIHALTGSRTIDQEILDAALELTKSGLTAQDIGDGLRFKWRMETLGVTSDDLMQLAYAKRHPKENA